MSESNTKAEWDGTVSIAEAWEPMLRTVVESCNLPEKQQTIVEGLANEGVVFAHRLHERQTAGIHCSADQEAAEMLENCIDAIAFWLDSFSQPTEEYGHWRSVILKEAHNRRNTKPSGATATGSAALKA